VRDDSEYDRALRAIDREQSKALVEQSKVLRERATIVLAASRRLRAHSAALAERVSEFLRLSR
jgi:hypothetical protein